MDCAVVRVGYKLGGVYLCATSILLPVLVWLAIHHQTKKDPSRSQRGLTGQPARGGDCEIDSLSSVLSTLRGVWLVTNGNCR